VKKKVATTEAIQVRRFTTETYEDDLDPARRLLTAGG
jgi:hypothetical protein